MMSIDALNRSVACRAIGRSSDVAIAPLYPTTVFTKLYFSVRSVNADVIPLTPENPRPPASLFSFALMSYEINISTSTHHSVSEVASWMTSFPFQDKWEYETEPLDSAPAAVRHIADVGHYRCVISRPRRTGPFHKAWFTSQTTVRLDTKIRTLSRIGRLDTVFAVALQFCIMDPECDVLLTDNGDEVFVRKNKKLLIQEDYFRSRSLANLLPEEFEVVVGRLCDMPDELRKRLGINDEN